MNRNKRWSFCVLGTLFCLLAVLAAVNVIVDPHGVFHADPDRRTASPNLSFLKINYLLRHREAFDSILLGSSRVANIDVRHMTGGRWYNLFLAAALPEEDLQHLRFLLENGVPVRNVMIGLDDFSFLFDPRDHLSELDLQPHPAVSGKDVTTFYSEYLFKVNRLFPNIKAFISDSRDENAGAKDCRFDIAGTGMVLCAPEREEAIERNREAHVRSAVFNRPWGYRFVEVPHLEASLAALREIADLAKKNNIRLFLFINPIHRATYLDAHLASLARFKRELAQIADFYDFSGLNSVTRDNYYYYETSHYRLLVGDMMLKVMLGKPDVSVPPDFGVLVTRENINDHLDALCREVQSQIGRYRISSENVLYAASCGGSGTP